MYAFSELKPNCGAGAILVYYCFMSRPGYRARGRYAGRIISVLLIGMLSGCEAWWNKPEDRAQAFIEAFIYAPSETAKLRDIAQLPAERNPQELVEGLGARVALDFLRAKQAQGIQLNLVQSAVKHSDASHRIISIRVTDASSVAAVNKDVVFQVYMEKNQQNPWRIVRVTH